MKSRASARFRVALAFMALLALVLRAGAQTHSYSEAFQHYQRGRQLEQTGKPAEAAKAFALSLSLVENLLSAQPGNPDLVSLQAWNLFRLGRHKEVAAVAQKALAAVRDPGSRDFRILETLAESEYFLGDSEEALKNFAAYMELAPPSDDRMSSAYYYVGECYLRLKKYEHADIAFSTATTMEKAMFYWWYRLGIAKENLSKYKQAYDSFGRALSLNSGFQIARDAQARVKAKAGL
jgi:tetratricopeptide (TPR) repeat protein